MAEDLIIIHDDQIDVQDIMRQIRANVARRDGAVPEVDPVAVSDELWSNSIGGAEAISSLEQVPLTRHDCDIVPHDYVIDWRHPVLGPPHAVVRRVINAEVRRYLDASLARQTRFNETVLRTLRQMVQENAALRHEIERLLAQQAGKSSDAA
jgi:hypothetical protein